MNALTSAPKKRRVVNYGSRNTPETDALHRMIVAVVRANPLLRPSEIAKVVGQSRQGIHYHLRKLAWSEQIDMLLRPYAANGQLAFQCKLRYRMPAAFERIAA